MSKSNNSKSNNSKSNNSYKSDTKKSLSLNDIQEAIDGNDYINLVFADNFMNNFVNKDIRKYKI
jgi:ketol-acid reductoisomerase